MHTDPASADLAATSRRPQGSCTVRIAKFLIGSFGGAQRCEHRPRLPDRRQQPDRRQRIRTVRSCWGPARVSGIDRCGKKPAALKRRHLRAQLQALQARAEARPPRLILRVLLERLLNCDRVTTPNVFCLASKSLRDVLARQDGNSGLCGLRKARWNRHGQVVIIFCGEQGFSLLVAREIMLEKTSTATIVDRGRRRTSERRNRDVRDSLAEETVLKRRWIAFGGSVEQVVEDA